MIRKLFFTGILFLCISYVLAQKLAIDPIAYKEWPSTGTPTISKDGKYMMYFIQNMPVGSRTLVIQSTDGKWKTELNGGVKDGQITICNKYLFFVNHEDSLGRLTLGTSIIKYIKGVSSCWVKETHRKQYLFYTFSDKQENLVLRDLKNNKEQTFTNSNNAILDENFLVLFKSEEGIDQKQLIDLVNLTTGKLSTVWKGNKIKNVVEDVRHHQLAFKTGDSVWHYKIGSTKPECIIVKDQNNGGKNLIIGDLDYFSKDGKYLFTSLTENKSVVPSNGPLEIWSYTDISLPSERNQLINPARYTSIINMKSYKIIHLQQNPNESLQFPIFTDSMALIGNAQRAGEAWSIGNISTWSLISLKSGKRKALHFLDNQRYVSASSCGKYLIYFNGLEQNYYSYDIRTEKIRNMTKGIDVSWNDIDGDDTPKSELTGRGINTPVWLTDDKSVLIFDRFDIWELDPLNNKAPVNLTRGYGKRNQIVFNYAFASYQENIINRNQKLYLSAFNKETKNNGFYSIELNNQKDPEVLSMGPYIYRTNSRYVPGGTDFTPIKAKNAEIYIVRRMCVTDGPNYFSTHDFRNFIRLSDLQPQKKYNWYTTELHSWKSLDGKILQGILYKPENFDLNKKYPIIFHYYERKSDGLNSYIEPESLSGSININIPSYVSNGYLVFCPDIYYKIGDPMQCSYDAVVSAANYVSALPFVNVKKMGIQGGSFGGFQTNYLVTHTKLFAAATSSSGVANWVSAYGSLMGGVDSQQGYYETGQPRIGASLWEKPESYIKNSPIFQLDKVTTPLLIMHTKNDGISLYSNAVEFFTGLRRMGKKAWMLAYEGNHGIDGKEADDFSMRMMQFFDHYLKDKPAPIWMLGTNSGLNDDPGNDLKLDAAGRTPGTGLLTPAEQKKVDNLMSRKPINIMLN